MERKIFQVIISILVPELLDAWLEVKGCHLRRGGRKEDLKPTKASQIFKAKAVDLEHSKAKKDDNLEWFNTIWSGLTRIF